MIKTAQMEHLDSVTNLALLLWPDHTYEEMKDEMKQLISDDNSTIALALVDDTAVGFAQCQLRHDYVEGTETSPVGYLEGIFVDERYRKQGMAKALLQYCEAWAKQKGCAEFGSDCELDNVQSLNFHLKVGFTEANRIICFCKKI